MSAKSLSLLCVFLGSCLLLALREISLLPDGKLRLYAFDVGQGDATLLVSPSGKHIIVDGGPDLTALEHLGTFMPFLDRTIELLVLTHPDKDHIVALPEVLRRYDVTHILMTGVVHNLGHYDAFLQAANDERTTVTIADPSQLIDLGDGLTLDVLWPPSWVAGTESNGNMTSVVLRASYGDHEVLLTGDAEAIAERGLLASRQPLQSDILKVGHHGSRTSTSTGFLLAVSPKVAIISAGRENRYGHPHAEVVKRLRDMDIEVHSTAEEGTVALEMEN